MARVGLPAQGAPLVMLLALAGCSNHAVGDESMRDAAADGTPAVAGSIPESTAAKATVAAVRARFQRIPAPEPDSLRDPGRPPRGPTPAIGDGVATRFERSPGGGLRPVVTKPVSKGPWRTTAVTALVTLPETASGGAVVEDEISHMRVGFALEGASDEVHAEVADGFALYAKGVPHGADVIHRPRLEGTVGLIHLRRRSSRGGYDGQDGSRDQAAPGAARLHRRVQGGRGRPRARITRRDRAGQLTVYSVCHARHRAHQKSSLVE